MNILQAIADPSLFAPFFQDRAAWASWRVFLGALFNLPIEDEALYGRCTGGRPLPTQQAREAFLIVGRRGGESFIAALVAVFLACFRRYRLSPGESAAVMVVAADRQQAKVIFKYARAFLESVAMLKSMVERETADTIELSSGITIEIRTANFRSIRGRTLVAGVLDEVAFWRSEESANPDIEILNALRPSMATIPDALLLAISTPYARRGALWDAHRRHFGKEGDTLVWQAPTRTMNPLVPQSIIDSAYDDDPTAAGAEYGGQFRSDVEAFVSQEAVEACVIPGRIELPPVAGTRYIAFTDPAGGSGTDAMTLAIGHAEGDNAVLDLVRERKPPFSPEAVVAEFAETLKTYNLHEVGGDRYGGSWPGERFMTHGIRYRIAERTKSEIYQSALPMLNSKRVELQDDKVLRAQLVGLERRAARSGKGPGGHDDVVNAAAGSLVQCAPIIEISADLFARGGTLSSYLEWPSEGRSLWEQR